MTSQRRTLTGFLEDETYVWKDMEKSLEKARIVKAHKGLSRALVRSQQGLGCEDLQMENPRQDPASGSLE